MKRWLLCFTIILMYFPIHSTATASTHNDARYGSWMWDASYVYNQDQEFFGELDALKIDTAIMNVGYDPNLKAHVLQSKPESYDSFIQTLHEQGREVEALYGNSDWALDAYYWHLKKNVQIVLDYNRDYSNRFDALHLDIEPHTFPDWEQNKESYLTQYLANLRKVKNLIDQHNIAASDSLRLVVVVPYWLHDYKFSDGRKFLPKLFGIVDEVAVMNYTRFNSVYIEAGVEFLKAAEAAGKQVSIGSEFLSGTPELDWISLSSFTRAELNDYLNNAYSVFHTYDSFKQFNVHTFEAYKEYIETHPAGDPEPQ
ncbi:hypothetical protein [Alkalihalobacillus sp. CinArs1]|uniref:hypothetical protein n=1 Tax=Alkalihalobacillus sp. CinArs1 TaxID=2995314 RepID=UPI0022DD9C2A|nr:hypothetical protein [Alkalihalobacillus sp. CinArs1]